MLTPPSALSTMAFTPSVVAGLRPSHGDDRRSPILREVALMDRRAFLTTCVAAGLGGLSREASAEDGKPPAGGGLPIGFLGGAHSHAPEKVKVVRESADWNLIGVCEDDESVRRQYENAGVPLLSQEQL